ncbi:hypothetical protein N7541_000065 [Penicillium brevicompactum]|uniref:Uncharacterized protein n=1 Tax=Penicillium brevicompactum TaxID=5074 RepID=A0A9W9RW31_PENBR|nr:hypothetical protein N7541_000065 [Penicillium brevicompactum]
MFNPLFQSPTLKTLRTTFPLAKEIHPKFVASCKYLGTVGDSWLVYIYEKKHLPGTSHTMNTMARIPPGDLSRQCNTGNDFVRFFAQSWNSDVRPCSDEIATLLMEFQFGKKVFSITVCREYLGWLGPLGAVAAKQPSLYSSSR